MVHIPDPFASSPTRRRWASVPEAAEYIGVNPKTMERWLRRGFINGYRVGPRLVRVDLNELDSAAAPLKAGSQP